MPKNFKKIIFLFFKKPIVLIGLVGLFFTFLFAENIPVAAAYTKFNRPIVDIFNDITKFLLSIVGGLAVFILILAGVYYITSAGSPEKQEKAKKMIRNCLFGVIITLISYGILVVIEMVAT